MKILMLNNEYPPLGGGTGTVNKEIITYLNANSDIIVDLVVGSSGKENTIENLSDNIRIIKIGLRNKNIHHASNYELIKYTIKAFFKARKMCKTENYDFSFAWSTIPAGFVSYLLNVFYKVPYMVRVGGPDIPGYEERYNFVYKLITPLIKQIWKKAKLITTKCQDENDKINAINSNLPLKMIYNGIDSNKFCPIKIIASELNISVICPARLIKRKGQDTLIRAIAHLKEKGIYIICELVGDGDEKRNYQALTETLGVDDLVNFTYSVSREKIVEHYNLADIFVLPSYNEGMSNAVLEAMACGLPIVVTDVGGTPELVSEGKNGFIFEKGNYKELASILEKLYNNNRMRLDMGNRSRRKVENFTWGAIGKEYVEIFENICR